MSKENFCSVSSCNKSSKKAKDKGENIKFFSFPKDFEVKKEWIIRCHRDSEFNVEFAKICSKHFTSDDYEDEIKAKLLGYQPKILKNSAVPSLELHPALSEAIREFEQCKKDKERKELVERLLQQHSGIPRTKEQGDLEKGDVELRELKVNSIRNTQNNSLPEMLFSLPPFDPKDAVRRERKARQAAPSEVLAYKKLIQDLEQRNNKLQRDLQASNMVQQLLKQKLSESESNKEALESKVAVLESLLRESADDFDLRWQVVSEMETYYQKMPKNIAGNSNLLEKTAAFLSSKILSLGIDIHLIEAFCKKRRADGPPCFVKSTKTSLNDQSPGLSKRVKKDSL